MIKNYLLITWRSMMKNKLFLLINVIGLAIGIGCCIVAFFNWEYDSTFDTVHVNREKIYRVGSIREFEGSTRLYGFAPFPLGATIKQNMPDAESVTRFSGSYSNFKVQDNLFPSRLSYVDPDFFDIFSFEFVAGNAASIKDKSKVLLSEEQAMKLFNSTDVVGKQITQVIGTTTKELEVGGVYKKQPANSSFNAFGFMHYDNYFDEAKDVKEDDWKIRNTLFVKISDPSRAEIVKKQIQKYRENNNKVREDFQIKEFVLQPFIGMAQSDQANDTWRQTNSSSPTAAVIAPIMMAVLVLLIACFNMTNTAIAISSRRLKEIGLRKVMGSMRGQLIAQFIGETTFICFLALIIGLFFGEVLLASWNSLWEDMKLTSHYSDNAPFLGFIIGMLVFTALLAGSYPALYISKFEPVSILKGTVKFGGTNYFTRVLLALQYAISLLAIVFAIAFYQNSLFQRDFDIGFNSKAVIIAYVDSQGEFETYRNAILANKDVISVAGSQHSVYSSRYNDPIKFESKQIETDIIDVGDGYCKTMGFEIVQGRDFIKDSETDRKESILVSQKFLKDLNITDPIGKEIVWMDTAKLYIIGVFKNVYTNGLWREMQPLMIRYTTPDKYSHVIVNGPIDKLIEINKFMEKEWKQIFPNRLYNGRLLNEELVEASTVNNNIVKMFIFLGLVAIVLSATGLFTLVSLNIIKKMKEIGVRKVLGASISHITRIINTEFFVVLTISSILGCSLGYVGVDALMGSIWKYYQSTTSITFVVSVSLMFLISTIAIGYKVFNAASMNPVKTLRDE
jgi:ABC-type antimicrobial peptide transport system permease subunit